MHLAGGGVLAHPVGSIVKAGDVDGLALDSHRVRRGVMVSGPGVGAAIIADGRAVHAVGLDVAVLVTLRQREGIRDHVAEDGGAAQRDSRAADGLADVREDVVQVGGATDGLVVIGRVRLVATAGHAGGIGVVGGHIVHILAGIAGIRGRSTKATDGVDGGSDGLDGLAVGDGFVGGRSLKTACTVHAIRLTIGEQD